MSELQLGKFKRNSTQVNTNELQGGIKREALQSEAQKAIFDAIDGKNGVKDGILDANEVAKFIELLNQAAGNEKLSKREAGHLLRDLGLNDIKKEELFNFVNAIYGNSEEIASSSVAENGDIVINYENGMEETIHTDMSFDTRVEDENGTVTVQEFSSARKIERQTITDVDNNSEVTIYNEAEKPSTTTITLNNNDTYVIYYEDGVQTSAVSTKNTEDNGVVISDFVFSQDGEPVLVKKVLNSGTEDAFTSEFSYLENGFIQENFNCKNQTGARLYLGELLVEENINENNGARLINRNYDPQRNCTEYIKEGENITQTITNAEGKRLSQIMLLDGHQYQIEYDGNGNTKGVVVQFNESIQAIANKFGCTVEELIAANPDAVKGNGRNKYFKVGAQIVIPKEVNADLALKGRDSREMAIARYQDAQERRRLETEFDTNIRAYGLKNYDGKGEKITVNGTEYTVIGTGIYGRKIVQNAEGKVCTLGTSDNGATYTVLNDEYCLTTNHFYQQSEAGKTIKTDDGTEICIMGNREGDAHGRQIGIDKDGNWIVLSGNNVILSNDYVFACDQADAGRGTSCYSKEDVVACTVNGKTYYFQMKDGVNTGKLIPGMAQQEANAVVRDLENAAYETFFGTGWGTDEELMEKANNGIRNPEVLARVRAHFGGDYNEFLSSELSDSEVAWFNADLVNNNAIIDQEERNRILLENLINYSGNAENVHHALDAINTRVDLEAVEEGLVDENLRREFEAPFAYTEHDNLTGISTYIYGICDGDPDEIKEAYNQLIDPNEQILTNGEINRFKAELGVYYYQEAKDHYILRGRRQEDLEASVSSHDGNVYSEMDRLFRANGKGGLFDQDLYYDEERAKFINAGVEVPLEDVAQIAYTQLFNIYSSQNIQTSSLEDVRFSSSVTGNTAFSHIGNAISAAGSEIDAKAALIGCLNTRENYDAFMALLDKPEYASMKTFFHQNFKESDFTFNRSTSTLSEEQIETNMQRYDQLRISLATLQRQYNTQEAQQGVIDAGLEAIMGAFGFGISNTIMRRFSDKTGYLLNQLEQAAQGKLTDSNGNTINFEEMASAFENVIDEYQTGIGMHQEHLGYANMGLDIMLTVGTMGVGSGFGALKMTKTGMSIAMGTTSAAVQYGTDRLNQVTSVGGDTMAARARAFDNAVANGLSTAIGMRVGMATSGLNNGFSQHLGGYLAEVGTDVVSAAGISYAQYGDVTEQEFIMNLTTSLIGNAFGRMMDLGDGRPSVFDDTNPETPAFIRSSSNNGEIAKPGAVGVLGEAKFAQELGELKALVTEATPDALLELAERANAFQGSQRRAFSNVVQDEMLLRSIATETNLGRLHNIESEVSGWSNNQANSGRRQSEILEAIAARKATLQTDGNFSVAHTPIDPQIKEAAVNALKPGVALTPDGRNAIKQYIGSITDPNELFAVAAQLKGKSNIGPKIKNAIATKAAELNIANPLKMDVIPETPVLHTEDPEIPVISAEEPEVPVLHAEEPETPVIPVEDSELIIIGDESVEIPVVKTPVEDDLFVSVENLQPSQVKAKLIDGGVDADVIHNNVFEDQGFISYTKDGVKYRIHYEDGKPTAIRTVDADGNKSYYSVDADGVKTPIERDAFLELQKSSNAKFNQAVNGDLDTNVQAIDAEIPSNVKSTWDNIKSKIASLKESFSNGVHVSAERLNSVLSDLRALGTKVSSAVKARLSKLANDLKALFRTQTPKANNSSSVADDVEPVVHQAETEVEAVEPVVHQPEAEVLEPVTRPGDADAEVVEPIIYPVETDVVSQIGPINSNPKISEVISHYRSKATHVETEVFTINGKQTEFEVFYGSKDKGSNTGYYVVNKETGDLYYAKIPNGGAQWKAEVAATRLYQAVGIDAPEISTFTANGKEGVLSKYIPELNALHKPHTLANDGYGMDVLLENWDAIGLEYDNTLITADGSKVIKLDNGGSFDYKAQGGKKPFTAIPMELVSMVDPHLNPQASTIYGTMSRSDLISSLEKAVSLKDVDIDNILTQCDCPQYATTLKKRRAFMQDVVAEMKNSPMLPNESTLQYMQRVTNSCLDKSIAKASSIAEIDDLATAVKFVKDPAVKAQLEDKISNRTAEINSPTPVHAEVDADAVVFLDLTSPKVGDVLPTNVAAVVSPDVKLNLADQFEIDFDSPSIKAKLNAMQDGDVFYIGREPGDNGYTVPPAFMGVSRKHLKVQKVGNEIVVTDISKYGTKISGSSINPVPKFAQTQVEDLLISSGLVHSTGDFYEKSLSSIDKIKLKYKFGSSADVVIKNIETPLSSEDIENITALLNAFDEDTRIFLSNNVNDLLDVYQEIKSTQIFKNLGDMKAGNWEAVLNVMKNQPSVEVIKNLDFYKGTGYKFINGVLWGNISNPDAKLISRINSISQYIDTQVVHSPMVVRRKEPYGRLFTQIEFNGKNMDIMMQEAETHYQTTGDRSLIDEIENYFDYHGADAEVKGFMSATLAGKAPSVEGANCWFTIHTKENTRAVLLDAANKGPGLKYETEVLFQKDSHSQYAYVKYENGHWNVVCSMYN